MFWAIFMRSLVELVIPDSTFYAKKSYKELLARLKKVIFEVNFFNRFLIFSKLKQHEQLTNSFLVSHTAFLPKEEWALNVFTCNTTETNT